MSIVGKAVVGLVGLVVIVVGGLAIATQVIDINSYRGQIADTLSKQLGRAVKLDGPIHLAISSHGVGLAVQDVSIGNPSWASRPQMAGIGELKLGVELIPLLSKQLVISELDVSNADILLETNAKDQHNWEMGPAVAPVPKQAVQEPAPAEATTGSQTAMPRVDELSIMNSQIAMRDKTGKMSTVKIDKLTLAPSDHGVALNLLAAFNDEAIKLSFKSANANPLAGGSFPYSADLTYAAYHLTAEGMADLTKKAVELNPFALSAGGSTIRGQLKAAMGGAKPDLKGTITSDKLDPADFTSKSAAAAPNAEPTAPTAGATPPSEASNGRLFSTTPIDVSALRAAEANLDITIGELVAAKGALKQVSAKLQLANGVLTISPFKAMLGEAAMEGDVRLDGSEATPRYKLSFKAPGVDIATLLQMMGTKPMMTGKGDADIELSGSGQSPHDLASSANGHIDITAQNGVISASSAGSVASSLAEILAPGSGNPTLNCLAVRFNVSEGIAKDNGILADSSASTVAGVGGFSLKEETVDLVLTARPKIVSTGGITPAAKISGPLMAPGIGLDTSNIAQNVAGVLAKKSGGFGGALGGLLGNGGGSNGGVPVLASAPAGQNACIYTLDHKGAASAAAPPAGGNSAVQDVAGQATGKAKAAGKQLLQGLFGH